jgi:hypothetical protein
VRSEQFRNRTRTATRGIRVKDATGIRANLSMVGRLAPWRRPRAALAIWSHKLLRWATPSLVLAALLAGLAEAAEGSGVAAAIVGALAAAVVTEDRGRVMSVASWLVGP